MSQQVILKVTCDRDWCDAELLLEDEDVNHYKGTPYPRSKALEGKGWFHHSGDDPDEGKHLCPECLLAWRKTCISKPKPQPRPISFSQLTGEFNRQASKLGILSIQANSQSRACTVQVAPFANRAEVVMFLRDSGLTNGKQIRWETKFQ